MVFRFQAQDSFLEYFLGVIGRFEKRISLSEKKPPLAIEKREAKLNATTMTLFNSSFEWQCEKNDFYLRVQNRIRKD